MQTHGLEFSLTEEWCLKGAKANQKVSEVKRGLAPTRGKGGAFTQAV